MNEIVFWVNACGFNGVDIDYEDNAGFQGAYDGVKFLDELTSGLATALPSGRNIIIHAPQTAYWDNSGNQFQWVPIGGLAPYAQIWNDVGYQITWINNHFYNTPYYDQDGPTKLMWYQNVAAITGPQKLLMGVLLSNATARHYDGIFRRASWEVLKPSGWIAREKIGLEVQLARGCSGSPYSSSSFAENPIWRIAGGKGSSSASSIFDSSASFSEAESILSSAP